MTTERRTKRRYAYELYPHSAEGEVRPLAVEVPYLYAAAIGMDVHDTNWVALFDTRDRDKMRESFDRTSLMTAARGRALLADALLQGLAGQEAWEWAEIRNNPEGGEWIWERAVHYGIEPDRIKPYPCGGEPDHHDHYEPLAGSTWRKVIRVAGPESECDECCEPLPDDVHPDQMTLETAP